MFEKLKFKIFNKAMVTEEKLRLHSLSGFVETGKLDEGEKLELLVTKSSRGIGIALLEEKNNIIEVLPADCDQIIAYKTSDDRILIAVQRDYQTNLYELADTEVKEVIESYGPIRFITNDENRLFIGSHLFELQRNSSGEIVATDDIHRFTGNSAEILLGSNFGKLVQ